SGVDVVEDRVYARCATLPAARSCLAVDYERRSREGSAVPGQARRSAAAFALAASMAIMVPVAASGASSDEDPARFDASVRIDPRNVSGGEIAGHFVG